MTEPPNDSRLKQLGFRCGLEIHQQLKTANKLFCRCPVGLRSDPPHARIIRHMRPTLSELGEYDGTALMEFKTKKRVIYELYRESVCTYEMDDTPPFPVNEEALDIAIEIALLLNCSVVDELHVSRKQYLDGSIPTGFQRTAIVGVNGWVPYDGKKVGIIQLALEEDACREISDQGHTIIFRTDRLSIPLIEVVTAPDLYSPDDVSRANWEIARILRSTGKIRRGIGTVRQDVNVSINGGTRVEIKGVPRIPLIPVLTRIEAMRQESLLKIRDILRGRGITEKTIASTDTDVAEIIRQTDFAPIRNVMAQGGSVKAVRLDGFADMLGMSVSTKRNFGSEISGRLRVIACLDDMPNLIHSEMDCETISSQEWQRLKEAVDCKKTDSVIVIWGRPEDLDVAVAEVKIRAREATQGVPNETRQVLPEGETDFERILPGPNRMYPDTDHPPLALSARRIDEIKSRLPSRIDEARKSVALAGSDSGIIDRVIDLDLFDLYSDLIKTSPDEINHINHAITEDLVHLRRRGITIPQIGKQRLREAMDLARDRIISWEGLKTLLELLAFNDGKSPMEIAEAFDLALLPEKKAAEEIRKAIDQAGKQGMKFDRPSAVIGYLRSRLGYSVRGKLLRETAEKLVRRQP